MVTNELKGYAPQKIQACPKSSRAEVSGKKVFLNISQNSQENTCARVSFLLKVQAEACKFIKKETLVQKISCELCEIFRNTFFYRTPPVVASVAHLISW